MPHAARVLSGRIRLPAAGTFARTSTGIWAPAATRSPVTPRRVGSEHRATSVDSCTPSDGEDQGEPAHSRRSARLRPSRRSIGCSAYRRDRRAATGTVGTAHRRSVVVDGGRVASGNWAVVTCRDRDECWVPRVARPAFGAASPAAEWTSPGGVRSRWREPPGRPAVERSR